MKLIILKESLLRALNSVEKSVGSGGNLPILKNVKIEAYENNSIKLTTTDLEIAIEHSIQGKVVKNGSLTLSFSLFNNVVTNLNSDKIQLELKDNKLLLNSDNYDASFLCDDINDFPIIPKVDNNKKLINIKKDLLHRSFNQSIIATQHSDLRPEINGIFLNYDKNNIFVVGTDSFRLVEKKINKDYFYSDYDSFSITIPLKTIESYLKIFNQQEQEGENINIFSDDNQIVFESENIKIISRLIDGNFPDYKNVIPKNTNQEIIIEKEELINAIKTTRSFSGQTNDITFDSNNKKIVEVYSSDNSIGESVYRIPVKIKGDYESFSMTFNWKYILDGLKVFKDNEIIINISEPNKPIIIKNSKESNVLYVVMPIKS